MKKTLNLITSIAFILIPFIVIQWHFKLIWLSLEPETWLYAKGYLISLGYVFAYYTVRKSPIVGFYLMWGIYLSLLCLQMNYIGITFLSVLVSLDFWINIVISIELYRNQLLIL